MTDEAQGHEVLRTSSLRSGGRAPKPVYDEVALLRRLEKEYDLGDWLSWRPTESGASNDSWYVETESADVVLRRSHDLKTEQSAEFEKALIEYLVERGFPAPAVVPTRTGAGAVVVDGLVHMVMRRLPGGHFDRDSPDHLALSARGLGRFHTLVAELPTDQRPEDSSSLLALTPAARERLRTASAVVAPLLPAEARAEAQCDLDRLLDDMTQVHDQLGGRLDELTYLVTHGSYGPTSVLLEDGHLSGVVDFDRAAHDLVSFDLAYATWVFCAPSALRRRSLGIDPVRLATFLSHYRASTPVTAADLRALPLALLARRLTRVTKKAENLLTKHDLEPRDAEHADKFARTLAAEAAQSRWIGAHLSDLSRTASPVSLPPAD
jgi:Ser/Thr protein kinase RdoA (MazF antagonist)